MSKSLSNSKVKKPDCFSGARIVGFLITLSVNAPKWTILTGQQYLDINLDRVSTCRPSCTEFERGQMRKFTMSLAEH